MNLDQIDGSGVAPGRVRSHTPEQQLMLAVLEDAIEVARHPRGGPRRRLRLQREAIEWLTSDDQSWPFAFRNVCDALALDADAVVTAVLGPDRTRTLAA